MTADAMAEVRALRARLAELEETAQRAANPRYWTRDTLAAMTPAEYQAHRAEIMAATAAGRVLRRGQEPPKGAELGALPTPPTLTARQVGAMTPAEYEAARPEIMAAMAAGTITKEPKR